MSKSNSSLSIKTKSVDGTKSISNFDKSKRDKNSLAKKVESPLQTILSTPRETPNTSILARGSFRVNNSNGSTPNNGTPYASLKNLNITGLNSSINASKMSFDVSVNYYINPNFIIF